MAFSGRSPGWRTQRCALRWNSSRKPIFCSSRASRLTPTIASSTRLFRMRPTKIFSRARRQVLHRRVAEILRDRFPDTAAAEPEVLAHHFTQAALTDAAIEWWGKAGEQALRRSAFQEAISHLGKAIEMADKTGEGTSTAATASASANRRLKLQTDLGKAFMWSRGFGDEESKATFIRARELAAAIDNPTERFTIYYGLWYGNLVRGELRLAREVAEIFLREAERGAWTTEYGFGRRLLGNTCLWQGDFIEAQANLVEALSIYDPERDREARF